MLKDIFNKLQQYPLPDVVHFLIIPALVLWIAVFIPFTVSVSINLSSAIDNVVADNVRELPCFTTDDPPVRIMKNVKITSLFYDSAPVDTPVEVPVTIEGKCLMKGDRVSISKSTGTGAVSPTFLATQFYPATLTATDRLQVAIPKEILAVSGEYNIAVWPAEDPNAEEQGSSYPAIFTVMPIVIKSISPESVTLPVTQDVELTIKGTGFIKESVPYVFLGYPHNNTNTFVSETELKITLPSNGFNDYPLGLGAIPLFVTNKPDGEKSNEVELSLKKTLLKIQKHINTTENVSQTSFVYNVLNSNDRPLDYTTLTITTPYINVSENYQSTTSLTRFMKPGTYFITENSPAGFVLGYVLCNDERKELGTNDAVKVEIIDGKTTTCYFSNTYSSKFKMQ